VELLHGSWSLIPRYDLIGGSRVADKRARPYQTVSMVVADPDLLGGKPTVRGTRLSGAHVLECLSAGMNLDEINESFGGGVPPEALAEALQVAAELADKPCVAAWRESLG
jgi:uncharacterized protein (DUF433 family)